MLWKLLLQSDMRSPLQGAVPFFCLIIWLTLAYYGFIVLGIVSFWVSKWKVFLRSVWGDRLMVIFFLLNPWPLINILRPWVNIVRPQTTYFMVMNYRVAGTSYLILGLRSLISQIQSKRSIRFEKSRNVIQANGISMSQYQWLQCAFIHRIHSETDV